MQSLRAILAAVLFSVALLPSVARADACDFNRSFLNCNSPPVSTKINADWWDATLGQFFNEETYDSCGGTLDYDQPQDVWMFACPPGETLVNVRLYGLDCDIDMFLLEQSCSTDACISSSTKRGRAEDMLQINCEAGKVFTISLERADGGFGWFGWADDCTDFDDFGYTLGVHCFENCNDRFDNDLDGLYDCQDPDCPVCNEICNDGLDNDFDNLVDCEDPDCIGAASCCDKDFDGYKSTRGICGGDDCNDDEGVGSNIHPGATEIPADNIDQDCDGMELCYVDNDGDFWGLPITIPSTNFSCQGPGIAAQITDCDDADPLVNPAMGEIPVSGVDEDCNGSEICYQDIDGDGFGSDIQVESGNLTCIGGSVADNNDDCDDRNALAYPGATEIPLNGIDNDCNGLELCYADADGDGFGDPNSLKESPFVDCNGPGVAPNALDCNDLPGVGASIHPGATEGIADGVDQNCDGQELCYHDRDDDGSGNILGDVGLINGVDCVATPFFDDDALDCDDNNPTIHPGAVDLPGDGIDQDCDGLQECYQDMDQDGWGSPVVVMSSAPNCLAPFISNKSGDCNDNNPAINPDADETPLDGIDQDCNGLEACYADLDGDSFGRATLVESPILSCIGAGISNNKRDCNDDPHPGRGASVYPGATEIPLNGFDDNCDGLELCYADGDADRYGRDELVPSTSLDCSAHGVSTVNTDCDDTDPRINPGPLTVETPADGIDSNCNGKEICYIDGDGDTYGRNETIESTVLTCRAPGVSPNNVDCDDSRADIYPGAPEGPGSEDYSCDGTYLCYVDADHDGYGGQGRQESNDPLCRGVGISANGLDCDDGNPDIHPLATEIPVDGIDQNCDGLELCWQDLDRDHHGSNILQLAPRCTDDGVSTVNDDCNDTPGRGESIYPGAIEIPGNGIDENCDTFEKCWYDVDNDGYGDASRSPDYLTTDLDCTPGPSGPFGYAPNNLDCNDNQSSIHPGRPEIPANGRDEDCDGADLCYVDMDGDLYGRPTTVPDREGNLLDCIGAGIADNALDCLDVPPEGASVYPGAPERPGNGLDDNCDGKELCYVDADADGWGGATTRTSNSIMCLEPGLSMKTGDCHDLDATIHPGAVEIPADRLDQDCDGFEDCYQDRDFDGFGFAPVLVPSADLTCRSSGVADNGDDCYDVPPEGANVYPGAPEIVGNGLDDNCDGKERCYLDADQDGYGRNATTDSFALDCRAPGVSPTADDCDDNAPTVHPGAVDLPVSGVDEDCDGLETCYVDMDWDGYGRATTTTSTDFTCRASGVAPNALDCNDVPPEGAFIHPGAVDIPGDGIDQDCNNAEACYYDGDGDGFGSTVAPNQFPDFNCNAPNAARVGGDCDDTNPNVYPGAPEIPANGIDEDCNNKELCYQDLDRDRYGNPNSFVSSDDMDCDDPGESYNGDDCVDSGTIDAGYGPVVASAINPKAKETCNGVDDDCDGWIDDEDLNVVPNAYWYPDFDGDGFGDTSLELAACLPPDGSWTDLPFDCNDRNAEIHPMAQEVCDPNDVDEDCNGLADDDDVDKDGNPRAEGSVVVYPDVDQDGYGDNRASAALGTCDPPPGYVLDGTDCLDTNPAVNPGRPEKVYDGLDNDCDPNTKDDDLDGDGYTKRLDGDCNDNPGVGAAIHPGAVEIPNGIDDDCDGKIDEGTIWGDDDGDGFTEAGGDCNDADATIYPGAPEGRFVSGLGIVGDNKDNDCDGIVDEGTNRYDDDGDGWTEIAGDCNDGNPDINPGRPEIMDNGIDDDCDGSVDGGAFDEDRDGYTELGGDCDPQNPNVHPGAIELPNGIDDDCDGIIDEGTTRYDDDGDGQTEEGGDCNDVPTDIFPPPPGSGPTVYSGAEEVMNGIDDDCDGLIDEGTDNFDDDGDGYAENQGDCNDDDPTIKPGAVELPNGIDDDCDGLIDEGLTDLDKDGYTDDEDCDDTNGWANPGQPEVCDGIDNDCVNGVDVDANGRNVCDGTNINEPPRCDGGCSDDCDGDGKADNGCSAAGSRGHQRLTIALIGLAGALLRRRRVAAA